MMQYTLRRLGLFVPSLVGLSILVFALVRLVPGDFIIAQLEEYTGSVDLEAARAALGLDRPWLEQYFSYVSGLLRGDLGNSFWNGQPVAQEIWRKLPVTVELVVLALLVSVVIAIPGGTLTVMRQGQWPDLVTRLVSFFAMAVPHFWLGTLVLIYSARWFQWIPPLTYVKFSDDPMRNLAQFLVPALVLGINLSARTLRMVRSSVLESMNEDYVRTARAKGINERRVVWKHALRNALIPVVTVIGTQFTYVLGSTVVIENIFAIPGIGRLTVEAINYRDYPQIQGNVLTMGVLVLVVNLIVDIAYSWIDPRVTQGAQKGR